MCVIQTPAHFSQFAGKRRSEGEGKWSLGAGGDRHSIGGAAPALQHRDPGHARAGRSGSSRSTIPLEANPTAPAPRRLRGSYARRGTGPITGYRTGPVARQGTGPAARRATAPAAEQRTASAAKRTTNPLATQTSDHVQLSLPARSLVLQPTSTRPRGASTQPPRTTGRDAARVRCRGRIFPSDHYPAPSPLSLPNGGDCVLSTEHGLRETTAERHRRRETACGGFVWFHSDSFHLESYVWMARRA